MAKTNGISIAIGLKEVIQGLAQDITYFNEAMGILMDKLHKRKVIIAYDDNAKMWRMKKSGVWEIRGTFSQIYAQALQVIESGDEYKPNGGEI